MNEKQKINTLTDSEKIRFFNGVKSWNTFTAQGKLPEFWMSDGPHGLRKQEQVEKYSDINASLPATCFPTASCAASSWNKELLYKTGSCLGKESRALKVNMLLAPGINIKRSPLCGRNFEYFSEDPFLAGKLASQYIKGLQEQNVACSLKHYAANNQEKKRQSSNSVIDERTLNEIYLRAFEIAVKESNPASIMTSYNMVNGEYAGNSKYLLEEVLRKRWNFKGAVISDWGACMDSAECVKAGMNLAMPDSNGFFDSELKTALEEGKLTIQELERANQQLLEILNAYQNDWNNQTKLDYQQQNDVALELASESAVLLKNNGMLPLKKGKVIVIGELAEITKYQGEGSSHINAAPQPNVIQHLQELGYETVYAKGYCSTFEVSKKLAKKNAALMEEAKELLKKEADSNSNILFFAGLTEGSEGEGFDRETLELPENQLALLDFALSITKNIAVITYSGSPIAMPFADKVNAILHMYLAGQASAQATADIVSGKINPSGHLAETFPLKIQDTPCFNNFGKESKNIEYREQVLVGYRHYDTKNIPVLFPFGHGLSYTTFEYSNLEVNLPVVTFKIKNTGTRAGSEVSQIYVVNPTAPENIVMAKKELRGFEKTYLEPGEEKTVTITLDDNSFKVFNIDSKSFCTAAGTYQIQVASSVQDVKLSTSVEIQGQPLNELLKPVTSDYYQEHSVTENHKGSFQLYDCIGDMAKESKFAARLLKILRKAMILTSKAKSAEVPSIKISIAAISENPLKSLISTSGGIISPKLARWILKKSNK